MTYKLPTQPHSHMHIGWGRHSRMYCAGICQCHHQGIPILYAIGGIHTRYTGIGWWSGGVYRRGCNLLEAMVIKLISDFVCVLLALFSGRV